MPRLLDAEEITAALATLPGVAPGAAGSLILALAAPTFPDAVRLVDAVAVAAEEMNHHPDVDLRWRTVFFTFSTHSAGGVTGLDVDLARAVLAAAGEVGAVAVAPPERVEIAIDCVDATAVRPFWRAGLGYREQANAESQVELHDRSGRGPVIWFQTMDPPRLERNRIHLDVYVEADVVRSRIDACLAAGGRLVTDAYAPSWWVLADAEGDELLHLHRLTSQRDQTIWRTWAKWQATGCPPPRSTSAGVSVAQMS